MTTSPEIPSVLQRIVATKHEEVAAAQAVLSLAELQAQAAAITTPRRGFANALRNADIGIIAEIKKASPSKGIINHNFAPAEFAAQYEAAGATCLSVLTDQQYFQGHNDYLREAKAACSLPALRKDFMVDVYQIYQSYVLGADCILLIMACLDDATALALHQVSIELGMDVLIETHTEEELLRALKLPHSAHNIYGINNRDLNTFTVDLQTSVILKQVLLDAFADNEAAPLLVTESGIHSADDIALMQSHDMHLFLIGEQFMKTDHPGNALQSLLASVSANR
jgi:indole-3-glycerol phosphate synthase